MRRIAGMEITEKKYFDEYHSLVGHKIDQLISGYDFSEQKIQLDYATQASAVYSSNIEGNSIDLNSYMNYQLSKEKFKSTKEVEEIENLARAYGFAQSNMLNEDNFLQCHKVYSETLLIKSKRGKYRIEKVGIYGEQGLVYLAVEPEHVETIMKAFFKGIEFLLTQKLSNEEIFYHASLLHLICAHIHPFRDGNGRGARLLEKWFLCEILGEKFWKIPLEKYYWNHRDEYYNNINLGVNFYELNYDLCLPFLTMLPKCLSLYD
jgi:Fic family protein